MLKLFILISGSGSNLQSLIDSVHKNGIAKILRVISNKADAKGIQRAEAAEISTSIIEHRDYSSKQDFEEDIVKAIDAIEPDYILLAGFMRILSNEFIAHYPDKIINIHPSILPAFRGLNTHQRAIDAGVKQHGATVHLVIPELDSGPIIQQISVDISINDDAHTLANKVLKQEHQLYPDVVKALADGRITIRDGVVYTQ